MARHAQYGGFASLFFFSFVDRSTTFVGVVICVPLYGLDLLVEFSEATADGKPPP